MRPSKKYDEFLQQSGFLQDPVQQHVILLLDRLQEEFVFRQRQERKILNGLMRSFGVSKTPLQGLYLWGGVGRGKTFVMDIFYETLPIKQKKRVHFHRFMKYIHDELEMHKTGKNPLRNIAQKFAREVRLLCLDEFVVTDIGDAMLIGRLLEALFEQGVVLVTTSNAAPEDLYRDGLQRSSFLPAIELLLKHCLITNLDGGQDYRTLGLKQTELYQFPHSAEVERSLRDYLESHQIQSTHQQELVINGRPIRYKYYAEDTVWFSFAELCRSSRSRLDYLELAQDFSTIVLTGIEKMDNRSNDAAKRFVSLIDVLYDHRVKLICSAEVPVTELYREGFLAFEFERTVSRLQEMQGIEYMGLSHKIY